MLAFFVSASLGSLAVAQSFQSQYDLTSVLLSQPQLSNFSSFLSLYPSFATKIETGNVTILAPSNEAFASFLNSSNSATPGSDALAATLSYHVLQEVHTEVELTTATQFLPTLLSDPFYTNVTGGQRVEVIPAGGGVILQSAFKATSSLITGDIPFFGLSAGVIHIVDRVLTPPADVLATTQAANLNEVFSIFVNARPNPALLGLSGTAFNWTIFLPNSTEFDEKAAPENAAFAWGEYHALYGVVAYSPLMTDGKQFQTMQGNNVTVTVLPNGSRYVNDVEIVDSDYLISNGVFHVLERSLNPNNTAARPQTTQISPTATAKSSTSQTTTSQTGTLGTSSSRESRALSQGAKVGIGVGALMGGVAIISLVLCYRWRKKHATTITRHPPGDGTREWKSELETQQPNVRQEMEAPHTEVREPYRHELQ